MGNILLKEQRYTIGDNRNLLKYCPRLSLTSDRPCDNVSNEGDDK